MAIKTYYITKIDGFVRRLDGLTLPWIDVSIPGVPSGGFPLDIMAFPQQSNKVVTVGRMNTIYWTNDSGSTWNAGIGTFTSLPAGHEWHEVWIVDANTAYVVGNDGYVAKTIDGGVTWDLTVSFPTFSGAPDADIKVYAVHFINPLVGIVGINVSGNGTLVVKTIDGGVTWTMLNGGNFINGVGGTTYANSIHLSSDQQVINFGVTEGVWRSSDGGVTFSQTLGVNDYGRHMTWINDNELWFGGNSDEFWKTNDGGITWINVRPYTPVTGQTIFAAHFLNSNIGFLGGGLAGGSPLVSPINATANGGSTLVPSEYIAPPTAIWSIEDNTGEPCYRLTSCDENAYPTLENVQAGIGVDFSSILGQVINAQLVSTGEIPMNINGCYTVSIQEDIPCDYTPGNYFIANSYSLVGTDCGDFDIISVCPAPLPLTVVGNTSQIQIEVHNNSAQSHDFDIDLGSCTSGALTVVTPSPISIASGATGIIEIEYTPTGTEEGTCEIQITGPCGTKSCNICYSSISVPSCPHFNICITGPSCAPDCIKPGEVVSFNLGGSITLSAYPTVVTFNVVNQVTQEVVFSANYPVNNDSELDDILINIIAGEPGKYCAEVCLPGCNTKRVLCFDVCQPFDIYKDSCNHWHVHRPSKCSIEEYTVLIYPFGDKSNPIVDNVNWDISQDNTFEFEVDNDGIYIFEMKDPDTDEVVYSFAAFETCGIQECFKILMDKIMCSCADPCCKRCDGSPNEHKEFARMTLNQLMPLYFTYLGMARRNELYTVGMQLISDDQNCFLHDATHTLEKIRDIIMDCGCLCPEQKNTATNRGGCLSC